MSTPEEVACSFIPVFFERLASNPAEIADMYSQHSSFVVVDFEYGTTEASGVDVLKAVEQWAQIVQGCQLNVESYTAAPLYGGVSVYVSITATSETMRHYFQFVTYLEACSSVAYGAESYFIRHQIVIRPGGIPIEPSVEEAHPEPVPEPELEEVEETAEPEAAEEPKAAPADTKAAEPKAPVATAPRSTKPKTWASLASAAPNKNEQRQPVKVVSHENGNKADAVEAAAPKPQEPKDAPAKPYTKAPRAPLPPIGDRLMFNIEHALSDEDVKAALGPLAVHIVSLRNNSANGHVFLDFAANEKVMEAIRVNPLVVGARKTRVNVYRQKVRE